MKKSKRIKRNCSNCYYKVNMKKKPDKFICVKQSGIDEGGDANVIIVQSEDKCKYWKEKGRK